MLVPFEANIVLSIIFALTTSYLAYRDLQKFKYISLFAIFIIISIMGFLTNSLKMPLYLINLFIIMILMLMGLKDFKEHTISNKMVYLIFYSCLTYRFVNTIIDLELWVYHAGSIENDLDKIYKMFLGILPYILNALVIFLIFYMIKRISKDALGGGDVKLLAALALYFNFYTMLKLVLIASVLAGIYGIVLVYFKKIKLNSEIAYGFFIAMGSYIVMLI